MLQSRDSRSSLDNGRLAAYLSNCLLEGVPVDRRVAITEQIQSVSLALGEHVYDRVSKDGNACVLMSGLLSLKAERSRSAQVSRSPKAGYERFLGEDHIDGANGGEEDVGFQGMKWFDEFVSCSGVLEKLRRDDGMGWDGGLCRTDRVSALEGLFCHLSKKIGTESKAEWLSPLDGHRRPGTCFGDVPWSFDSVPDMLQARAATRCVVAVVEAAEVALVGLQRGVHRVLQADKVRIALQDIGKRHSDSLLSIAKACGVRMFRQLSRDMMMDLSG